MPTSYTLGVLLYQCDPLNTFRSFSGRISAFLSSNLTGTIPVSIWPLLFPKMRTSSPELNEALAAEIETDSPTPFERTPLLSNNHISEVYSEDSRFKKFDKSWIMEIWALLKDAAPVILAYMLQMSLQTATVIIAGRRSPMDLSVAAFSLMFALVTGWMIALGGTTALDTLASSTFTGSKDKHDLGILLQRGFFVLGLFYIPVAIIWACSNYIFLALGQDPDLSYQSSRFLTCLIPGGLGYIFFETLKKYLQAQGQSSLNKSRFNSLMSWCGL